MSALASKAHVKSVGDISLGGWLQLIVVVVEIVLFKRVEATTLYENEKNSKWRKKQRELNVLVNVIKGLIRNTGNKYNNRKGEYHINNYINVFTFNCFLIISSYIFQHFHQFLTFLPFFDF